MKYRVQLNAKNATVKLTHRSVLSVKTIQNNGWLLNKINTPWMSQLSYCQ